jgi:hypothetical protein
VLGDPGAEVGDALAHGAMARVVADAAPMTHRERVLPRREQRLQLRSQGFQVWRHTLAPFSSSGIAGSSLPIQIGSGRI